TLGGMIGNNSAGARSIAYGLTADHVLELDVVFADGTRATLRRGGPAPGPLAAAVPLGAVGRFPALMRRVSGYALDALAGPEADWPRLVAGSEGTLCVVEAATLRLVELPAARGLALLPFATATAALEAVPGLLEHGPSAVELIDRHLLDPSAADGGLGLPPDARGAGAVLVVEQSGEAARVADRLRRLRGATVVLDPAGQARVWAVRRAGIARALGAGGDAKPLPFIEDPAVPTDRLADFHRAVRRVLDAERVPAVWYGHASVGCLHIRPLIDLRAPGAAAQVRRIAEAVAEIVVAHHGSLSGEHGDGRARSELLPRMYDAATMDGFARLKRLADPDGILNPGVIVDPEPLDAGLRLLASPPLRPHRTAMSFAREGGLQRAAEACNGNGACRARAGVMCPSFQALGDERHATRGRAAILRAALEGHLPGGLADDGLHEALSLCLACKACAAECPTGVDMARLKVEALAHRHAAHGATLRQRLTGHAHLLLAAGARAPALAAAAARFAGRDLPVPRRAWRPGPPRGDGPRIALMADTFTRFLHPEVGDAAVAVLEAAGARVEVVDPGCCGRPLLSQGFVAAARRTARRALDRLAPLAMEGVPIAVLEPSCWSMLADDVPALVAGDARAAWVRDAVRSFEAVVAGLAPAGLAPDRGDVVVHAHCHSRALGAGEEALAAVRLAGDAARPSGAGCCGMAGAFGYEHPELSRRIAEMGVAPAARAAATVVAPGTSCRAQILRTTGRRALHPAEYLAARLPR
ncbi:MAG: FAD-linked oxidase C-terminal domain-containing protein, partial [Actinomycetota bacterium]